MTVHDLILTALSITRIIWREKKQSLLLLGTPLLSHKTLTLASLQALTT